MPFIESLNYYLVARKKGSRDNYRFVADSRRGVYLNGENNPSPETCRLTEKMALELRIELESYGFEALVVEYGPSTVIGVVELLNSRRLLRK